MPRSPAISAARERLRDEGELRGRSLLRRYFAGETMNLAASDRCDIVERLRKQRGKLLFPAGYGSQPEFARAALPRRRVDAEHGQTMPVELSLHGRGRMS